MLNKLLNKISKKTYKSKVYFHQLDNPLKIATDYEEGFCFLPAQFIHADSIVYSFGAGEDIETEATLINLFDCEVFIFDPTPRSQIHIEQIKSNAAIGKPSYVGNDNKKPYKLTAQQAQKIHFENIGLWNKDTTIKFYEPSNEKHVSHSITNLQKTANYIEVEVKKLSTIMEANGHDHIDLLKLDIEGAEFAVIDELLASKTPFSALYLEFHHEDMNAYKASTKHIESYIKKLQQAGYVFLSGFDNKYYSCIHKSILNQ